LLNNIFKKLNYILSINSDLASKEVVNAANTIISTLTKYLYLVLDVNLLVGAFLNNAPKNVNHNNGCNVLIAVKDILLSVE
jgi:hypothetical protein